MIEKENPYTILNVSENADNKEIKHRFYQLSKVINEIHLN